MIVDDRPIIADRLLAMLGGIERLTAVAVARSKQDALAKCRSLRPDVVVLDVQLPDGNGLDTVQAIKAGCPHARVFVFSNHVEYRSRAEAAGADGFFDKSLEFEPLLQCLDLIERECSRAAVNLEGEPQ